MNNSGKFQLTVCPEGFVFERTILTIASFGGLVDKHFPPPCAFATSTS